MLTFSLCFAYYHSSHLATHYFFTHIYTSIRLFSFSFGLFPSFRLSYVASFPNAYAPGFFFLPLGYGFSPFNTPYTLPAKG